MKFDLWIFRKIIKIIIATSPQAVRFFRPKCTEIDFFCMGLRLQRSSKPSPGSKGPIPVEGGEKGGEVEKRKRKQETEWKGE